MRLPAIQPVVVPFEASYQYCFIDVAPITMVGHPLPSMVSGTPAPYLTISGDSVPGAVRKYAILVRVITFWPGDKQLFSACASLAPAATPAMRSVAIKADANNRTRVIPAPFAALPGTEATGARSG